MIPLLLAAALLAAETPAATPSTTAATSANPAPAKMVCRIAVDTGSLVRRTRRCAPAADWSRRTAGEQDSARDMIRTNGNGLLTN